LTRVFWGENAKNKCKANKIKQIPSGRHQESKATTKADRMTTRKQRRDQAKADPPPAAKHDNKKQTQNNKGREPGFGLEGMC
jgi:hypothetical protein